MLKLGQQFAEIFDLERFFRFQSLVEQREKFLVGQPAPIVGVERLVAGGADAAFHLARVGDAGEDGRHPVAEFNP